MGPLSESPVASAVWSFVVSDASVYVHNGGSLGASGIGGGTMLSPHPMATARMIRVSVRMRVPYIEFALESQPRMSRHALWIVCLVGCMDATSQTSSQLAAAPLARDMAPAPRTWRPVAAAAPISPSPGQLMTDGTVIFSEVNSAQWWKLTPDEFGGYEHGTWSRLMVCFGGFVLLFFVFVSLFVGWLFVVGG